MTSIYNTGGAEIDELIKAIKTYQKGWMIDTTIEDKTFEYIRIETGIRWDRIRSYISQHKPEYFNLTFAPSRETDYLGPPLHNPYGTQLDAMEMNVPGGGYFPHELATFFRFIHPMAVDAANPTIVTRSDLLEHLRRKFQDAYDTRFWGTYGVQRPLHEGSLGNELLAVLLEHRIPNDPNDPERNFYTPRLQSILDNWQGWERYMRPWHNEAWWNQPYQG